MQNTGCRLVAFPSVWLCRITEIVDFRVGIRSSASRDAHTARLIDFGQCSSLTLPRDGRRQEAKLPKPRTRNPKPEQTSSTVPEAACPELSLGGSGDLRSRVVSIV